MAQTPNLDLYYSFPGSLPHKSFVEQLSENMSKIDSAYSRVSSALSSMSSEISAAYALANEKATEDTFTTTVSTQDWIGSGDASLAAFTVGQILSEGDKIHFDTTKGDELEAYLSGLTYGGDEYEQGMTQLLVTSTDFNFTVINLAEAGIGQAGYLLLIYGAIPVYASNSGSVEGLEWVAGFQNLDANGDYTVDFNGSSTVCEITTLNDTTPPTWNGVIIGTAGSATVTAPYTKTVELTGILATDNPVCDIVVSDTYATAEQELIDWSNIYKITTDNGSITLYAKEPPVGAMTIQLKVVR